MRVFNIQPTMGQTMNTTITSDAFQMYQMFGFSIQVTFTGTPTGTFKLQASSDPVTQVSLNTVSPPTHWTDVANSSQAVSAAGSVMWNVSDVMYNWVRVVYTDGSGGASTAVISNLTFNGKGP
jgi:hypothetical protein